MKAHPLQADRLKTPDWRTCDAPATVAVASLSRITGSEAAAIKNGYDRAGLVLVDVSDGHVGADEVRAFSGALGLGETYSPTAYRGTAFADASGNSVLRVPHTSSDRPAGDALRPEPQPRNPHPSFHSRDKQLLHTDGTLEPLGKIRSTILACAMPAAKGGATRFYNITQAFADLAVTDPDSAYALLRKDILVRAPNIEGIDALTRGPAFTVNQNIVRTRASFTPTDSWCLPSDESAQYLLRGLSFLLKRADNDGDLNRAVILQAGQLMLFANDRIVHGRDAFEDTESQQRSVTRYLYESVPATPAAYLKRGDSDDSP